MKRQVWCKWIGREKEISKCLCCKIVDIDKDSFSCGHIVAESQGGKLEWKNLKPICVSCNSSMGSMNMNEFIKKYNLDNYIEKSDNDFEESTESIASNAMVCVFYCKFCKYKTEKISHYKTHLVSKKHFDNTGKNTVPNDGKIVKTKIYCCESCDKIYMSNQSLQKHQIQCKDNAQIKTLQNEIMKLKNKQLNKSKKVLDIAKNKEKHQKYL